MSDDDYTYDDYLSEKDPDQYDTLMELRMGFESMGPDEFNEKYESLDSEYRVVVDEDIAEFAADAIGDDNWASDGLD